MVGHLCSAFFVDGDDHCAALADLDVVMVKILIVSIVLVSALGVGLLAAFGVDISPDLPLPEAHVGLLDAEMDRLGAAWAVFDADAGAWVLQDDMRRELGRVVLTVDIERMESRNGNRY